MSTQSKSECSKIREKFSSFLDGQLETVEQDTVRFHAEICAECRYELSTMYITRELLHRIPPVPVPRSFTLAEAPAQRISFSINIPSFDLSWLRVATAAAAVILVLLLVVDFAGVIPQNSNEVVAVENPTPQPTGIAVVPTPSTPAVTPTATPGTKSWDTIPPASDTPIGIATNQDNDELTSDSDSGESIPEAMDPMSEREVSSPPPPSLALYEIAAGVIFAILGSIYLLAWHRKRSFS